VVLLRGEDAVLVVRFVKSLATEGPLKRAFFLAQEAVPAAQRRTRPPDCKSACREALRRVKIQAHPRPNLRHVGTPHSQIAVLAEAVPRRSPLRANGIAPALRWAGHSA
jgi:hypothetical protein